jgi:lysophospholipase L1-like esterase
VETQKRQKTLYIVMLLLLICMGHAFAAPCGDVDSNGNVDIIDALLIARQYVGMNPSIFDATVADVNADGSVNIVDALRVAQYYVGLITELSCATTVTPAPTSASESISVACGSSSTVGSFQADQYYSGGSTYNNSNTIDVSQIPDNPPPAALFNNERYGAMSYTFPGFDAGGTYAVTLYFAETYLTSTGGRVFNVSINGTAVLTNFDIYSAAGGRNIGVTRAFTTTADSSGQIVIQFTAVTENPKINGISIRSGTAPTPGLTAVPTVGPTSDAYQPCKSYPCKILPFGDSITYGVGDEGNAGYRGPLFATIVAAGQKITFTGSLSNGPSTVSGQTFPQKNEGHSGWGIAQVTPYSGGNAGIVTVIPSPAFSSGSGGTPDIILLHIGTNDQGSLSASQMINDLKGLLDKIITNAPDALIVVAQIIPLGYGTNDVIRTYNQAIPGVVQERAAAGRHIVLVDMYTGFTTSTMIGSDSVHPNGAGYKFMADRWYSAIGSYLPE